MNFPGIPSIKKESVSMIRVNILRIIMQLNRYSPTLFVDLLAYFDPIRNNKINTPVLFTIRISAILIELFIFLP